MPVTVVVGGQYGSEGKGKVALDLVRRGGFDAVVRVGGPNSGHTIINDGEVIIFRQLPTASIDSVVSIIPAGSYIDLDVLSSELDRVGATARSVAIDPNAAIITEVERAEEASSGQISRIGSTGAGVGAAVVRRARRDGTLKTAKDVPELKPFLADTVQLQRELLEKGKRLLIEGTQGFGLSILHGGHGQFATSRDTTASGFLSEAGLSPLDVDQVVLVLRCFPIRVAGNSGPLKGEIDWTQVGSRTGRPELQEFTTVSKRVRRVADFDPEIVRRAIAVNCPSSIVLNHLDHVADLSSTDGIAQALRYVQWVEGAIGREVTLLGVGRDLLITREELADHTSAEDLARLLRRTA